MGISKEEEMEKMRRKRLGISREGEGKKIGVMRLISDSVD